jgi:hypothetical protein
LLLGSHFPKANIRPRRKPAKTVEATKEQTGDVVEEEEDQQKEILEKDETTAQGVMR